LLVCFYANERLSIAGAPTVEVNVYFSAQKNADWQEGPVFLSEK